MSKENGKATGRKNEHELLFHFCRVQLPAVQVAGDKLTAHLERTFALHQAKAETPITWDSYLENLYPLDWFVACACLDGDRAAWDYLFASRASRSDVLLIDALRARAARLYPGDEERQDAAVTEFWSQLLVSDSPKSLPILARYDGQRPLVPWLIRVFQNAHISQLRQRSGVHALPEDNELPAATNGGGNGHWHESFCLAARDWLGQLGDNDLILLGLRMRYRQSQREVAQLLGVHEGTISRQITHLRDKCLEQVGQRLVDEGWTGEDLSDFVLTEMGSLLLDEPRLSADRLVKLLAERGKQLPVA
ncbi:MAG: sigma-70 family RNA polymerase sigma factor [Gemmataceae bacterium]